MTPCPLTQAKLFTPSSSLAVSKEMREMMLALLHRQTATAALCHGTRDARFTLKQRRNLLEIKYCFPHTVEQEVPLANDAVRHA